MLQSMAQHKVLALQENPHIGIWSPFSFCLSSGDAVLSGWEVQVLGKWVPENRSVAFEAAISVPPVA